MKLIRLTLLIALLSPLALLASIANFTALSGDVSIIENGKSSKASINSKIDENDKIVTGANGKAQIKFSDSTVITLGINSDFAIEEYVNDKTKPKASFSIGKGTFKALTGKMGKINPDGFKLKTKTATIGIRGTGILGQVTPSENKVACT
ncbi:MAG: FecR family protein, partial [Campylobacterales bacterium]